MISPNVKAKSSPILRPHQNKIWNPAWIKYKIIALNKRITEIETSGFGANDLKVELETLKQKHLEITHLLGLEIDKTIV